MGPFEIIFITVSFIVISHASLPASPGGLGAVRRRLRRVVPPGVRGSVVRNGRERRLHLRGLLPEGRWHLLRWRHSRRGSWRGERHSAVHIHVRRRAEPAAGACRGLLVSCALHVTPQPSSIPSAAAGASAGQLALKGKFPGLHLNTVLFTKRSILASFSTCKTVPDLQERTGLYLGLIITVQLLEIKSTRNNGYRASGKIHQWIDRLGHSAAVTGLKTSSSYLPVLLQTITSNRYTYLQSVT